MWISIKQESVSASQPVNYLEPKNSVHTHSLCQKLIEKHLDLTKKDATMLHDGIKGFRSHTKV